MAYAQRDPDQASQAPEPAAPGQGNYPSGGGYNPGQQVTVPQAPSVPDIPGSNYPSGGGYNPGTATPSYGAPAPGAAAPGGGSRSSSTGPSDGLKPNDPNNPNNPTYQPSQPQAPATGGGGGAPDLSALMKSLGMDPAIQKQYADQQQQYLDFYTGKAFDLQQQIAKAQATGDWNGAATLQKQLQDVQLQISQRQQTMAEQQQQMNNLLQASQATGMYGSAPTQSFQQLMNQYALTQGNQNLTARGQDLSAMGIAGQYGLGMAGQYGNQASQLGQQQLGALAGGAQYGLGLGNLAQGYGNTLTGVLGAQAGYDVQMQQLQNQLAQSPLVAWYTARGLPPPQSAIQSAQQAPDFARVQNQQLDLQKQFANQALGQGGNPLMQQYLQAAQQAGTNQQTAFDRLMNKQDPNFNLGKFTPPDLKWDLSPNNPNAPRPSVPIPDARQLYDKSMQAYQNLKASGKPWDKQAFIGVYNDLGVPADVAGQAWEQVSKSGRVPQSAEELMGIIAPLMNQYNQSAGPVGLPFPSGQPGSSYTPPGAGSYGQYLPPPPGGGAPQEPGEQPNPYAPGPTMPGGGQGPFARSGAAVAMQGGAGAAGGYGGMPVRSGAMLAPQPGAMQGAPPQLPPGPGDGRISAAVMPRGGMPMRSGAMIGPTGEGGQGGAGAPFARSGAMVQPTGGTPPTSFGAVPYQLNQEPRPGMQGDVLDRNGQMVSPGMGRDQLRPPMPSPLGGMSGMQGPMPQGPSGMPGGQQSSAMGTQQQPPPNVPPMSTGAPPWAQAALSGQNLASFTGLGSALPFLNPTQWNNMLPQEKQAYLQVAQSQGLSPQDFLQQQQNSQPQWGAMPGQARYQSY